MAYNQQLAVLATHPSNATSTPGQGPQGPHSQDPSATACPFDETITALMWVTFAKVGHCWQQAAVWVLVFVRWWRAVAHSLNARRS